MNILTTLQDLRELKLLSQKGKGSATYYLPGLIFPEEEPEHVTLDHEHGTLAGDHGTLTDEHGTLASEHGTLGMDIPADIRSRILELGSRPGEKIRSLILELCSIRALPASQLAAILGNRNPRALKREHLEPMRSSGQLVYLYPDMERHPQQAYLTNATPIQDFFH